VREAHSKTRVKITPEMAKAWLADWNSRNFRLLSPGTVSSYARLILQGKWGENSPEAIQFDWDGFLGNGQHRLSAIVESGVTLTWWVERGLDPAGFRSVDKPKARTGGDELVHLGFRSDVNRDKAKAVAARMIQGVRSGKSSREDVVDFGMKHQRIIGDMILALRQAKPNKAEVTAAFARATFSFPSSEVFASADRYAQRQFRGEDDPLSKLDRRVNDANARGMKSDLLYAAAVSAIRADLEGRTLRNLYAAEADFPAPWDPGFEEKVSALDPETSSLQQVKGWNSRIEAVKRGGKAKIQELLKQAEEAGMVVFLDPAMNVRWRCRGRANPSLVAVLSNVRDEVQKVLLETATNPGEEVIGG
jgi:hypothetical protein